MARGAGAAWALGGWALGGWALGGWAWGRGKDIGLPGTCGQHLPHMGLRLRSLLPRAACSGPQAKATYSMARDPEAWKLLDCSRSCQGLWHRGIFAARSIDELKGTRGIA